MSALPTLNLLLKRLLLLTGVLAVLLGSLTQRSLAQDVSYRDFLTEDERNNIQIFKDVSPSVVYVTNSALQRNFYSLNIQEIPRGTGTGFVWDKSGLIVTNVHVIQGADRVRITLQDRSTWDARLVGRAPGKDLALLQIDAPPELLHPIPLGDSSLLEVGRKVIAIGNPFGLDTTMTVGVISALGREINSLNNRKIRDVIQTDASINPGNSGGPLLNSMGQLVGVNTQIVSPSGASAGIGFAIPVNTVKKVIPQLLTYGREVRPILGISPVADNYARDWGVQGVVVLEVDPELPAGRQGMVGMSQDSRGRLILGDVIIAIDDESITNNDDMANALEQHEVGDVVTVTTRRQDEILDFRVRLSAPDTTP